MLITLAVAALTLASNDASGAGTGADVVLGGAGLVIFSILARDIVVSSMLGDKLKVGHRARGPGPPEGGVERGAAADAAAAAPHSDSVRCAAHNGG